MAKTDYGAQNIFNITDPQRYRCQMLYYHARVSRLYLSVFKEGVTTPVFYLLFSDVGYVQCPSSWQGAAFDIGTQDECLQLMLDSGLIGAAILRFPNAYASLTDYARLYRVQTTSSVEIRLIASAGTMLPQLPADIG